jgi:DNA-directed RNA polymerase specialized sigma24 family protein
MDRSTAVRRQLTRLARGRRHAAAGLYDCLGGDVFAVAAAVTGRHQSAHEVTVETFREIATTADSLRSDPDVLVRILSMTQRLAKDRARQRPLAVSAAVAAGQRQHPVPPGLAVAQGLAVG